MTAEKFTILCLFLLVLSGCGMAGAAGENSSSAINVATPVPYDNTINSPIIETNSGQLTTTERSIVFRLLYSGFTAINLDDIEAYSRFSSIGTCIIEDEAAWQDFMDNYCPGIWYFEKINFECECLIASVATSARPSMSELSPVEAVTLSIDGYVEFQYSDDLNARVYALNTADTTHFAVTIAIISRKQIPETLSNAIYGA